jgi:type IV pilus assembly protein PilY1
LYNGSLPSDFGSAFANETWPGDGPLYPVTGTHQIAYGSGNTWAIITRTGGTVGCSNATWATYGVPGLAASGDPTPGIGKQCRSRTPPASSGSTDAVTGLTADSFFYSRVKVCESTAGVLTDPRTNLCLRYPSGNYKPVGNLQKYSDRVRVAAFGYLNDNTADPQRSGGVLRAVIEIKCRNMTRARLESFNDEVLMTLDKILHAEIHRPGGALHLDHLRDDIMRRAVGRHGADRNHHLLQRIHPA